MYEAVAPATVEPIAFGTQTTSSALLIGRTRFQNNKSKYLIEAKNKYKEIIENLRKLNAFQMREWLIENIKGISYKESGHFLRNIGERDLAILDRHILKNLFEQKVIEEIPKTLTKK